MVIPQKSGWLIPPGDHAGMINTKGCLEHKIILRFKNPSRSTAWEISVVKNWERISGFIFLTEFAK